MADEDLLAQAQAIQNQRLLAQAQEIQGRATSPAPAPAAPQSTAGEAGLQALGQGIGMRYLPEAQAYAAKIANKILPESWGADPNESYNDLKDYFQKQSALKEKQYPSLTKVGEVAGAVIGAPALGLVGEAIPGAAMAARGLGAMGKAAEAVPYIGKAAPLATRAAESAAIGAGYGAAENPGENDSLETRLNNALTGMKYGAGSAVAGQAIKKSFPYLARASSGISPEATKTYIERQPEVKALIERGPDAAALMAEDTHNTVMDQFQKKKSEIGRVLSSQINGSPNLIERDKIFAPIEDHIKKLSNSEMALTQEGKSELEVLKNHLASMKEGLPEMIKPETAWDLKDRLYQESRPPYDAGKAEKQVAGAAQKSWAAAKSELDKAAGTAGVNKQYSDLADLGDKIQKYFKDPVTTERTLMQLDKPSKGATRLAIDRLDNQIGKTPIKDNAKLLQAYGEFQNPELLPKSSGGTTSTSRSLGLSALFGGIGGIGGEQGQHIGNALGNVAGGPLAVKTALDLYPKLAPALPSAGQIPYVAAPWLLMNNGGQ